MVKPYFNGRNALAVALLVLPTAAQAEDQWQFSISPYLWLAGLNGDVATIPGFPAATIDISSNQALQDLDAGFMGVLEAKKGRHSGFLDVAYTDVRSDLYSSPALNLTLKSISKNTIATAGYAYELYDTPTSFLDAFFGARYWKVDTELDLVGGLGILPPPYRPPYSIRHSESWVDPVIGIHGRSALGGSRYFVEGVLGGGGFGVGSDHFYDASLHLGYQWSKLIGTTLGYRRIDVKYKNDAFLYDVTQEGWLLGMSFTF